MEQTVIKGDVLQFADWEADFDDYIEEEGLTEKEALRQLKNRFVERPAREAISRLLYQNSAEAYREARIKLRERDGDTFSASRALRKKLKEWPKVSPRDGMALQKFADFLSNCRSCMRTMRDLQILNDVEETEKLVEKLPEYMRTKWARQVRGTKREERRFLHSINSQHS